MGCVYLAPKAVMASSPDRYWVGGNGTWDGTDTSHWSTSSGGASGASVPNSANDVFFDANSFSGAGQTVTAQPDVSCADMAWTTTDAPAFSIASGGHLNVYGSLTLASGMTMGPYVGGDAILFYASSGAFGITSHGVPIDYTTYIYGTSATWTLQDDLNVTAANGIGVYYGTLDADGHNVTSKMFSASGASTRAVKMGSGTWTLTGTGGVWNLTDPTSLTFDSGSSKIVINDSGAAEKEFQGGALTYHDVTFAGRNILVNGSNTFHTFAVNNASQADALFIQNSSTQTVTNFTTNASAGNPANIKAYTPGTPFTLSKSNGTVAVDYMNIADSTATGGAHWYAGSHSTNGSGNTGWIFTDPVFTGTGSGTAIDPYLVTSCERLQEMGVHLSSTFKLTADIDCSATSGWNSGEGFVPVGDSSHQFQGTLNGNGKKIIGLYIYRPTETTVGLFGVTGSSSSITKVGVEGARVTGGTEVAGLVGNSLGPITQSYVTGSATGTAQQVGGLVGRNEAAIHDSYSRVSVIGTGNYYGGFVGLNAGGGTITDVYSTGSVSSNPPAGGLAGDNSGNFHDSFWDLETSGQATSAGGVNATGKTTAEMKTGSTFTSAGWDFTTIWKIDGATNGGYPFFKPAAVVHSGGGSGTNPPSVSLFQPNGGTFTASQSTQVIWSFGGDGIVSARLSLSTDGGVSYPTVLDSNVPGVSFIWKIPADLQTSRGRIRVEGLDSSGGVIATGSSTADFTVTGIALPLAPLATVPPIHFSPTDAKSAGGPTISDDKSLPADGQGSADCPAHWLIKLPDDGDPLTQHDSTVYYCGRDGKRWVFPNAETYFSWYPDFSGVVEVGAERMARIPIGKNATYRPGTRMIKLPDDPKVYAVSKDGGLHLVPDETTVVPLYGPAWKTMIDVISPAFFADYNLGAPIASSIGTP